MSTLNGLPTATGRPDDAAGTGPDYRALTEYVTVLEDGDERSRDAPRLYTVASESGSQSLVDIGLPACECPDFRCRNRPCEHVRRVLFAVGRRDFPGRIDPGEIDPRLGIHVGRVGNERGDPACGERVRDSGRRRVGMEGTGD